MSRFKIISALESGELGAACVMSLSDTDRLLTLTASATAMGDLKMLDVIFGSIEIETNAALRLSMQKEHVEVILQTHLFAGFARTINALVCLKNRPYVWGKALVAADLKPQQRSYLGETLCEEIYGSGYKRLRQVMSGLHPDFDSWMIEHGYGRTLSRAGLSVIQRELCVVAVIGLQEVAPQLKSHLIALKRLGVSLKDLSALILQCRLLSQSHLQNLHLPIAQQVLVEVSAR